MIPLLSICIPTYEQNGVGAKNLKHLLDSIYSQEISFLAEIVISDNSQNDVIKEMADSLYATKFNVKYIRSEKMGVANNSNNAIDNAQADIIKVMYMDDYFLENTALEKFYQALTTTGSHWCIADSIWMDDNGNQIKEFKAHYSENFLRGSNTIGMPSVMAFKKTDIRFDANVRTSLDSWFYYQLNKKYGSPAHINQPVIAQRIHKDSVSSTQRNYTQTDIQYMKRKIAQENGRRPFPFGGSGVTNGGPVKSYKTLCAIPSDINEHLPLLKEISMQCEHVTEFGVRDVVSTYALIEGTPKTICSYDIKHTIRITPAQKLAQQMGVELKYRVADTRKLMIEETDFLFIDTLHNYEQLSQELLLHSAKVRKYIGFHDVTSFGLKDETGEIKIKAGLLPAILEFLANNTEWKIYRYHHFNNGLLILKKSL